MFKVIRSNTEIAITPPRISRLPLDLVFHHVAGDILLMCWVKGQRSRSQGQGSVSQRKVMYQLQKCYNTAIVSSNMARRRKESGKRLWWLGRPQVAMHSQCTFSIYYYYWPHISGCSS